MHKHTNIHSLLSWLPVIFMLLQFKFLQHMLKFKDIEKEITQNQSCTEINNEIAEFGKPVQHFKHALSHVQGFG